MQRLITLMLVLLLAMIVGCDGEGLPKDGSGDVHGAWAYMQLFIEKRLQSPSTADYPFGGAVKHVEDLGRGRYRIDSWVDSQNGYGATIRTNFVGVIRKKPAADQWVLESLTFE